MIAKRKIVAFAKQNLKDTAFWYNSKQMGLGIIFLKEINEKVHYICKNPLHCQIRYGTIRIAFTKKFSFGIHYEYLPIENQIIIYAVFHTSQNPTLWEK